MSETRQSYDPYKLIDDVVELLTERGLSPQRSPEGGAKRMHAACMLLNYLEIDPLIAHEAALDLDGHMAYNRRIHGD